jgi:hypothetical protein
LAKLRITETRAGEQEQECRGYLARWDGEALDRQTFMKGNEFETPERKFLKTGKVSKPKRIAISSLGKEKLSDDIWPDHIASYSVDRWTFTVINNCKVCEAQFLEQCDMEKAQLIPEFSST